MTNAKRIARDLLAGASPHLKRRGGETLRALCDAYLAMPKRAGEDAANGNVGRLSKIVETAWGKTLEQVKLCDLTPKLWSDFMAKRLPGGRLDLSTRRAGNAAINSAVRAARSIFIAKLRPAYREAGIEFAGDLTTVQWLPTMHVAPVAADDAGMLEAWRELIQNDRRSSTDAKLSPSDKAINGVNLPRLREPKEDLQLHLCIGLARFAGLRRDEIRHARGSWVVEAKGSTFIALQDRPEEGFSTKTGRIYRALVIDDDFAALLRAVPDQAFVCNPDVVERDEWFERVPQAWLRPFVGAAKKPLHRLRGLYADAVKILAEDAMLAHLAGVRAASKSLGHTSTVTTLNHYLTP